MKKLIKNKQKKPKQIIFSTEEDGVKSLKKKPKQIIMATEED